MLALELDTSVDDFIRKNYNPNKIEDDIQLPALPKILNEKDTGDIIPINSKPNLTPIKKPVAIEKPIIKPETPAQPQVQKQAQVQVQKPAETKTQLPLENTHPKNKKQ